MSALSEATAVRRNLIESIEITIKGEAIVALSTEDEYNIAESVADSLIDSEWVVRDPDKETA